MRALDEGMVCIKTAGRDAGKKAVIIEVNDEKFVTIAGPQVKKRKCNIAHLMPTGQKVSGAKSATQKELAGMLE